MEKASGSPVRTQIAVIAGPKSWHDTRKSWLSRVVRRVPTVSFRTVKSLWYGEIADQNHWAARDIKRAAEVIATRQEAASLAQQLENIALALNAKDPDLFGPDVSGLVNTVSKLRGRDSSRNNGS